MSSNDLEELNALFFPLYEEISQVGNHSVGIDTDRITLVNMVLECEGNVRYWHPQYSNLQLLNVAEKRAQMEQNEKYKSRMDLCNSNRIEKLDALSNDKLDHKAAIQALETCSLKVLLQQSTDDSDWKCILPEYEEKTM